MDKNNRKRIWLILSIACFGVAGVSGAILIRDSQRENMAMRDLETLQAYTSDAFVADINSDEIVEIEVNEIELTAIKNPNEIYSKSSIKTVKKQTTGSTNYNTKDIEKSTNTQIPSGRAIDWAGLKKQSEDIYAWIYVPDAKSKGVVDYPVLQHPTDNSYYLKYNMDGSKGFPGCLYTENYNTKTFNDANTVIYGHNLKKGGMFSSLHDFENKESFFGSDHFIYIYTPDYTYIYKIFAAYEFSDDHLLDTYDFENEYAKNDFVKKIKKTPGRMVNFKDDVVIDENSKLITLSTCASDHNSKYRFLVSGVLTNPKE